MGFLEICLDNVTQHTVGSCAVSPVHALGLLRPDRRFIAM